MDLPKQWRYRFGPEKAEDPRRSLIPPLVHRDDPGLNEIIDRDALGTRLPPPDLAAGRGGTRRATADRRQRGRVDHAEAAMLRSPIERAE